MLLRLIQMIILVKTSTGFLLDNTCLTGNLCSCNVHAIECERNKLADVPRFNMTGPNNSITSINLKSNSINVLRTDAFLTLTNYVSTPLKIILDNNNLSVMEDNCFRGLEDYVDALELDTNNLQTIPVAISSLKHIRAIILNNNPIKFLDPRVLIRMSSSFDFLSLSLNYFNRWPNEFQYLPQLQYLTVYGLNATHIRDSDFRNLAHTTRVWFLSLSYSPLEQLPAAFCDIDIYEIAIDHNAFVDKTIDFFSICHTPVTTLWKLNMIYNDFDVLPDIGKTFPNIAHIYFSGNSLRYINNELTPMSKLGVLVLDKNKLVNCPSTLRILSPNLWDLSMSYNFIVYIDNLALNGLANLQYLFLDGNPLEYIGAHAFAQNNALQTVSLQSTKLTTVPCAVSDIAGYVGISLLLADNMIECDCRMQCLSNINFRNVSLVADPVCMHTGIRVQHFITTDIKVYSCV